MPRVHGSVSSGLASPVKRPAGYNTQKGITRARKAMKERGMPVPSNKEIAAAHNAPIGKGRSPELRSRQAKAAIKRRKANKRRRKAG